MHLFIPLLICNYVAFNKNTLALPSIQRFHLKNYNMAKEHIIDVIIIGGSYAGLSAAMALGRSLRHVLIIDSGNPCNRQTPHSHNLLTQDGQTPAAIAALAKEQVLQYKTVGFHEGLAINAIATATGFEISTSTGDRFAAKKILLATGITDLLPAIPGFAACWGISILHCPYCHGYEIREQQLGLLANGEMAMHMIKLLHNLSKKLVLFTNGPSTLTADQTQLLAQNKIPIVEEEVKTISHDNGRIESIQLNNDVVKKIDALFARVDFTQHSDMAAQLGYALTAQGFLQTDEFGRTTVPGVYAAGDNVSPRRALSVAISTGNMAGAAINGDLAEEIFHKLV